MPVNVISTIKPKNQGTFPVAEAVDIKVTDDLRLDAAYTDIISRLTALEYVPVAIKTFTANPTTIEMGSTPTVTLQWGIEGTWETLTLNGNSVTGQYTTVQPTTTTTYTLVASDDQTESTKTTTVTAANQIYWGAATDTSTVTSLANKTLSNTKGRTITVNAGSGKYIIYALPKRLGTVTFKVNGFDGGFSAPEEKNLTNASGYSETYYVYKSTNSGLGDTTVVIS